MENDLVRWRELDDWVGILFPSAADAVLFTGTPAMVPHRGTIFWLKRYIGPDLRERVEVWGPPAIYSSTITKGH